MASDPTQQPPKPMTVHEKPEGYSGGVPLEPGKDTSQGGTFMIYDSELDAIQHVWMEMKSREKTHTDLDAFQREAKERFQNINWDVDVVPFYTDQPGVYYFEMIIKGRMQELSEFDHERMKHEVQHNLLGLDEPSHIGEYGPK
jgi:hypothetical protein